ncbi:MAG: dihydrofolate reductase family protein [Pseudomonadota bacterium]
MPESRSLLRLYPEPGAAPLRGLYLDPGWRAAVAPGPEGCFVYANFVASLDGRIAIAPDGGRLQVPDAIANPRDWRLYLELAAQSDVLLVSGRYVRELAAGTAQAGFALGGDAPADLLEFRAALGLAPRPAIAVLSAALDLPPAPLAAARAQRRVRVITGARAPAARRRALEAAGCELLVAGIQRVEAPRALAALAELGLRHAYASAGPEVLRTLVAAGRLDRLYLTTVLRLLGGARIATLLGGEALQSPPEFRLREAYLDQAGEGAGPPQLMQVFDALHGR